MMFLVMWKHSLGACAPTQAHIVPEEYMQAQIDLILRESDGTLVFVEVRLRREGRSGGRFGGALASVDMHKQRRLITAAECYLARFARTPPARFDVVLLDKIDAGHVQWLKDAFSL